ncbi:MAG: hypothetical protein IJZ62_04400, partial [Clostridia bacterium]|nr:hypothetical protein [Clostridia bacterium]
TLAINVTANGINTTLNLTIEANTYVSGENEYSIYAAYAYDSSTLSNEIKTGGEEAYSEDTTATADYLLGRYTGTYYIVPEKNGKYYILSTSSEDEEDSVGKVSGGKINFNDFWDKENKTFEVRFTPDGENYYGLAYDITFTVLRNVVVETTSDDSFEIYDTASASTQLIGSFLSVKRVIGNSPLSSLAQYNLKNQILSVDASGNLKRTAGTLEFKAGDLYKEETIEVTIEGYSVGYVTIKVKLLDDVYSAVAEAITYAGADGSMGTASIQIVDGIKYVIIDGSLDATWIASLSISGGEATFLQKDSSKSLKVSLYTLLDGNELDPTKNGAIIGLNADYNTTADYILVQFENSTNGSNEFLRLPAIVTNVGPSPVKYQTIADDEEKIASQAGRADAITNYSERLLEVSLMTPDKLIEKGIYDTITAGESDYELLNKSLFNSGLAYTINVYSGTGAENSAITNKLIKGGISEGKISLYDLADNVTGDYYIALKFTLTANGYQQAFYYLLKVEPNVTTKTIYPYDGTYENLTKKEGKIDLNETFDNSTLANGKQRFEVYSLDDESYTSIASYSYIDQIIQVSINDVDVYTTEEAWSEFITLSLDNATHTITYKTDTTKPLKFVVRRSYVTASDASIEQIVNGSIDYVFAVNDNAVDYSIRFVQMGDNPSTDKIEESFTTVKPDEFGDTTYTLPFRNGATDVAGLNGNNYTGLKVLLVRNAIAGSAESGTVVYDELTVQQSDIEGDTGALVDYSYDNAKEAKGELKLNLNPYISQDTKITFVAFTTYGYTAKIVFDIKANDEVSLKTGVTTTLNGGADTAFGDIYSVKLNGEKTTTYTVTGISATESGKASELVSLGEDNNITLQDIAEDKTVDLTFTLDFGDERTFTFTQTFTLKANVQVKAEALVAESEIVAGEGVTVILKDLFDGYPTDSFKGDCSESDEPIDISGDVYTYVINTAFVSTREDKEVKFTFTLNSGDKVTAVYKYTIVPAVEMSVNYPDPDGDCTSLAMEYIEDKQDLTMNYDFFGDKAPFADTVRILIKSGSVAEGDSVVSYTTVKDSIDYTDEDFSIFLKTLSNASLYLKNEDGSYSEKSLSTNTEITGNTLKFERGLIATQSAVVVLTISYKGVSRDYTIYISDVLYSANGNYVTNNTSIADYETTSLSAETIYVDKTNISDLFADDRMAKVNISSTASIGEYYLVFADIQKMEVALWGSSVNLVLTGPTTGTIVNFSSANSTTKFTYKGETITQTGSFVWDESNNTVSISGTKDEVYTVNYYSNFYASYPLYIKSSDLGKTLTVDLGISMSGKTFYSAMLVSKLEDANVGLATDEDGKIATNRLMQVITTTTESDGSTTQSKTNLDEGYISDNKLTSSAI